MKINMKKVPIVTAFVIFLVLLINNYTVEYNKKNEFKILKDKIYSFSNTTKDRVAKSVVTLPDDNLVVGINDNVGFFIPKTSIKPATIKIESEFMKTKFIEGVYGVKDSRLDAIVPMSVSFDSYGGSKYILLFNDRGDAAIEKSYARLGKANIKIESIDIVPENASIIGEEYRVDIKYSVENSKSGTKEVIIPVIDGHFDEKGTVTK